jgi:hypothetical protein
VEFRFQAGYATQMIIMLVRDNDAVYHSGMKPQPRQPGNGLPDCKTTIEQQASISCLDHEAISARSATQAGETHSGQRRKI